MDTKNFLARIVMSILLYTIAAIIMTSLLNSAIIVNDVALEQIQHSNDAYIAMSMYDNLKHTLYLVYNCITVFFAGTVIYNICKFIKTKTKEKN